MSDAQVFAVYGYQSVDGNYAYIGQTGNIRQREKKHRYSDWNDGTCTLRMLAGFETRSEALAVEKALIELHKPTGNMIHRPGSEAELAARTRPALKGRTLSAIGDVVTSSQLVETSGITYRQLSYWTTKGVLRPILPDRGSGRRRLFDERQQSVARTLKAVTEALGAVNCATLREIADQHEAGSANINDVVVSWSELATDEVAA